MYPTMVVKAWKSPGVERFQKFVLHKILPKLKHLYSVYSLLQSPVMYSYIGEVQINGEYGKILKWEGLEKLVYDMKKYREWKFSRNFIKEEIDGGKWKSFPIIHKRASPNIRQVRVWPYMQIEFDILIKILWITKFWNPLVSKTLSFNKNRIDWWYKRIWWFPFASMVTPNIRGGPFICNWKGFPTSISCFIKFRKISTLYTFSHCRLIFPSLPISIFCHPPQ